MKYKYILIGLVLAFVVLELAFVDYHLVNNKCNVRVNVTLSS